MQTIWDKTSEDISKELASKSDSELHKQTIFLGTLLRVIHEELAKDKSVTVENTVRQVVGRVAVERPDWIKELFLDTKPIEKKLDYIASAVIRKEVVKEFSLKRPEWIKELIPKEVVPLEPKDLSKPIVEALKAIQKEIQEKTVVEEVAIKGSVEVAEPKWWKPVDIEGPIVSFGEFLKKLADITIFKVKGEITGEVKAEITNTVDVNILNQPKEIVVAGLKKQLELISAQLVALGSTGSNSAGGGSFDKTGLATEETLQSIAGMNIQTHDYLSLGYTGSNLTTVVYKTGGSGGTTVATLTLAYDGSDNLISVTKS